jgi:thermitase
MFRALCVSLICVFFAMLVLAQKDAKVAPNEVIVKFRKGTDPATIKEILSKEDIDHVQDVGGDGAMLVHSRTKDTQTLLRDLKPNSAVEYVEPNAIRHTAD